ncbi:hypothetical protein Tco_0827246 [Tanacetum coccineum]
MNDAMGYKKKVVVVTSDPLALVAEKTKLLLQQTHTLRVLMKSEEKKEDKKADEKKRDMSKVKCYNVKKEGYFSKDYKKAKDQAWMESSSDSDQEINANMVFMAKMEKVLSDSEESSSSAEETIAEESFHDAMVWIKQKSQENGQNRTNTDTGTDRVYKSRENAIMVNSGQPQKD